jgi:WD40 repeat protein
MADPIAIFRQQQAAQRARAGEGVAVEVSSRSSSKNVSRRPSKLANLMDESPPLSPASMKRKESKDLLASQKTDDVLGMLGIKKTDDMLELEKKKADAMMKAVNTFAHLLARKKSLAEQSKTKWKAVARLYRDGKLTLAMIKHLEEGGTASSFGQPSKKVSWSSAKFDVEDGCSANVRVQFEPQYNEFSKVSTIPGDKACVATRLNGSDCFCACAYFDGCITVFDVDEGTVFNTQDVGCLKQMPSGDWKMTETDDDTVAVMNLRWCPAPNDIFMAATATGGILALWQVSQRVQELEACTRDANDAFYGLDWTQDGNKIVVGGSAKKVKVYDPHRELECIISEFEMKARSVDTVAGHINRITAVKCSPRENNLVCSAAMDNTVQLWDLRQKDFVGACAGALVDGDALDIDSSGRYILTAGADNAGPRMDVWDMRNCGAVYQSLDTITGTTPTCVGFSRGQVSKYIHLAGTTENRAYVYKSPTTAGTTPVGQMLDSAPLSRIAGISEVGLSFRCLGVASRTNTVAYGNNDGLVSIVDYSFPN